MLAWHQRWYEYFNILDQNYFEHINIYTLNVVMLKTNFNYLLWLVYNLKFQSQFEESQCLWIFYIFDMVMWATF